jgi:hypothetical protein
VRFAELNKNVNRFHTATYPAVCPDEDAVLAVTATASASVSAAAAAAGGGFGFTTSIRIPVSGAKRDDPFEVARAAHSLDTYTYFEDNLDV